MPDTVITQTISTTDAQVLINCGDNPLVSIEVSGTWAGTLNIETNLDPDNALWRAGKVFTEAGATASAAPTANGRWIVQAAGIGQVRARLNPATSGAAVVTLRAGDNETFGIGGTGGGGGGGGPVTAANPGDFVDGWDATQGLKADAGITTDIAGTAMGFRRGNIKLWIAYLLRFPAALGGTTSANSLPVVLSSDGPFAVQTGSVTETAPATDTASSGLNGRLQRVAQRLTSLIALLPAALVGGRLDVNVGATVTPANVALDATVTTTNTEIGGLTETAPATDTASSGLNGRAQRIAQRLTSLIALFPAALGTTTAANSLPVTLASDSTYATLQGGVTETAPATDTASSGANGRLQRVAQRITSLIALLPSALVSNRLDVNLGAAPATVTVQGGAAAGTALAGNPVRLGVSDATNIQDAKQAIAGATAVTNVGVVTVQPLMWNNSASLVPIQSALSQGFAGLGGSTMLPTVAYNYNGSLVEAIRSNVDVTDLASAARTTTQTVADITVFNGHSLVVTLDMTVVGTGSVTLTINYKDPASGKYILLLSGAAVTTNSTNRYQINPNIAAVANSIAQADLGRVIQLIVTAGNANSATYSLGHTVIS